MTNDAHPPFTRTERDLMNAAVRIGLTDAVGLGLLILEHEGNALAVLSDLDEISGENSDAPVLYAATEPRAGWWLTIRSSVYLLEHEEPSPPARAQALDVLNSHQVRV